MNQVLLYDNSSFVPQDISNLLGVSRFSEIYYRKRSLDRWVFDICVAAGIQFIELSGNQKTRETLKQINMFGSKNTVVIYLPSFIAFGCSEEEASIFLRKLSLTRASLAVFSDPSLVSVDRLQAAVMVGALAQSLLQAASEGENLSDFLSGSLDKMHPLKRDVVMIDMRNPLHFTEYLTSNFDVRFFNSVQTLNDFVLIKRSSDIDKLRQEYQYYSLLSSDLQMFFIQPYDFIVEQSCASYKMERLFVPDMALQWIHGSLDEQSFKLFLDKVFYYITARPLKSVSVSQSLMVHQKTYRDKVNERLAQLKTKPDYKKIEPYLDANFLGIDALFKRYFGLLDKVTAQEIGRELRIGHGDLCFSNILYSKTTGLMRFIDPRGADNHDALYMSPYYDLAKLSHSIIGNYDFINYGLYQLTVDADLKTNLKIERGAPSWARPMFEKRLRKAGFSIALIRLFEASLFLSMVPLHIDSPKKVLAFLINASEILRELEHND